CCRSQGDGPLAALAPVARDLRAARRRRDLRLPRNPGLAAVARGRACRVGVLLGACCPREVVGKRTFDVTVLVRALAVARRYGDVEALASTDVELAAGETV